MNATRDAGETVFDAIVDGAERCEGLFTLYRKGRDLFAELQPEQMETDLLFLVTRGSGLGERWLYYGDPVKDALVRFRQVDDQIYLIQPNTRFRALPGSAEERSVQRSFADSILAVFPVEATDARRGTRLINLSRYLLTDLAATAHALNQPEQPGGFSVDPERSYWGKIRALPRSLELDLVQAIVSDKPHGIESVPDARGFQMTIHYSLAQLAASDYRPRLADPRIGCQGRIFRDFSRPESGARFLKYAQRWNLQKRHPEATVSPPREPILFYLENTIPPQLRPAMREGLLMWNRAFERIGIRDAIEVHEQPDDADWDGNDFGYNTVRWVSASDAGYACGFYRMHPVTCEVLKANITVQANWVFARAAEWHELAEPIGAHREPSAPEKEAYLHQAIRWMVAHEMGHILGIEHNHHASTMLSLDDLHATEVTRERGLSSSVMDYLPPNLAPKGRPQGDYFTPTLGPWDLWMIEYLYTPIDAATPEEELPMLRRIAARSASPELAFGWEIDEDCSVPGADPLTAAWDLSDDPIAWAEQRLRLCRETIRRLESYVPAEGDYSETRRRFVRLLEVYLETLRPVARFVGGIYTSRSFHGDPEAALPLCPVPRAEQERALKLIARYLFAARAFHFPPALLNRLARDVHGPLVSDRDKRVSGSAGYPLREQILEAQKAMLARLTDPAVLSRIANNELHVADPSETLTLADLFAWQSQAIWGEVIGSDLQQPIPATRRSLQRAHLTTLIGLLQQPAVGTPEEASTCAWAELSALRARLTAARHSPALTADAATRAHLAESAARIARALDA
jgi:hypothetical protein